MSHSNVLLAADPPEISFPDKFQLLWRPKRYKVWYGGRGSAKSWSIARALIIMGSQKPLRIMCVREQQNSMAESVHKLLSDQIQLMGYGNFYEIQRDRILAPNGTTFAFEGIKQNSKKIKSYEGIDICWVEEADNLSYESMKDLVPTIRKPGSEIWISFNPNRKTDYVYRTYVVSPPANCESIFVSWRDNEWFSKELSDEMEDLKLRDYDAYLNVWEGQPRVMLAGAVYMEELRDVRATRRITDLPYTKGIPVDTFWDLGISDSTTIWFRQRVGFEWHYIDYYEARQKPLSHYLTVLQERGYLYGTHFLPHDAKAREKGTLMSIEERFKAVHPGKVKIVKKLSLADGIDAARTILGNSWFDEERCERGLECLYNYRYEVVDQLQGQLSQRPVHNWASDGADSYRYSAVAAGQRGRRDETFGESVNPEEYKRLNLRIALRNSESTGWMGR